MINDHLSFSEYGLKLLQRFEGFRSYPYDDTTGRYITEWNSHATIGYGYLISKKEWEIFKDGIDSAEAEILFVKVTSTLEDVLKRAITKPIEQHQFDALILLAYNIGVSAFKNSSVVKMINDPSAVTKYSSIELAWKAWNKQGGIVIHGLVNRRRMEWDLFANSQYLVI